MSKEIERDGSPRILMVNFPTEIYSNWGCAASSQALGSLVKRKYPGAEIRKEPIFWEKNPEEISTPLNPLDLDEYFDKWVAGDPEFFRNYKWADMIIVDGEGTLHDFPDMENHPEPLRILARAYGAKRKFGKKVEIVNHTVSFVENEFHPLINKVYNSVDYVSVREPLSKEFLNSIGVDAVLASDAAWLAKGSSKERAKELLKSNSVSKPYFIFFLSQLVKAPAQKTREFISSLRDLTKMEMIAFAAIDGEKARLDEARKDHDFPIFDLATGYKDVIALCGEAEFVVSGRFHASIFSAIAGTPFLMTRSNTYKMEGLSQLLELDMAVPDFENDTVDYLTKTAAEVFNKREQIRRALEKTVPKAMELTEFILGPKDI